MSKLLALPRRTGVLARAARVALVLGGTLPAVACGWIVGMDEYGVAPKGEEGGAACAPSVPGARVTGITFENPCCSACLAQRCAGAVDACNAEPSCAAYLACDAKCTAHDVPCQSLCMGIWGATLRSREAWDLLNCRSRCEPECGLPCGGSCLGNIACDQCLASQCSVEGNALTHSAAATTQLGCEAAAQLLPGLSAPSNAKRCESSDDAGSDDFVGWRTCFNRCTECGLFSSTPDFRCIDEVAVPIPRTELQEVTFELFVSKVPELTVWDGANVRPCRHPDGYCDAPRITNSKGLVELTANRQGLVSFFDYLRIESDGMDPILYYQYPPVTQTDVKVFAAAMSRERAAAYAAQIEVMPDPALGAVLLFAGSCGINFSASGVRFESSFSDAHYIDDQGATFNVNAQRTGALGGAFFARVPVGTDGAASEQEFRGFVQVDGKERLLLRVKARVEPGNLTWIYARPTPSSL